MRCTSGAQEADTLTGIDTDVVRVRDTRPQDRCCSDARLHKDFLVVVFHFIMEANDIADAREIGHRESEEVQNNVLENATLGAIHKRRAPTLAGHERTFFLSQSGSGSGATPSLMTAHRTPTRFHVLLLRGLHVSLSLPTRCRYCRSLDPLWPPSWRLLTGRTAGKGWVRSAVHTFRNAPARASTKGEQP